jgi:hypothetical protein
VEQHRLRTSPHVLRVPGAQFLRFDTHAQALEAFVESWQENQVTLVGGAAIDAAGSGAAGGADADAGVAGRLA